VIAAIPSLVWTIAGIVLNAIGVILLFLFGMPFRVRRHGQSYIYQIERDPKQLQAERLYGVLGWVALLIIIAGAVMQIMGAINMHAQFVSVTVPIATMETLSPALTTIAAVAAVVWTGGLIVLQLRERQKLPAPSSLSADEASKQQKAAEAYKQQTTTIQAGMACAAFGFLVPLVLLIFTGLLLHIAFLLGTLIYARLTRRNPSMVLAYLQQRPPAVKWAEINIVYALPTLGLFVLTFFPHPLLCAFLSLLGVFLAYYYVSGELRSTSDDI
jgi:hypothetical protein